MYCPACGTSNDENSFRCVQCAVVLPRPEMSGDPQAASSIDRPLSRNEWIGYTLGFLFIPCVNVIVSSVLYYSWRAKQPTRANQINRLGWMVFGGQIVLQVVLSSVFGL